MIPVVISGAFEKDPGMADDGNRLTIRKLHPTIGAEVSGIDLAAAHGDAVIETLRAAWVEHCVLVFHDQAISDAEQVAFSRCFGELEIFPQGANRSVDHPEIFRVSNVGEDGALLPPDNPDIKYLTAVQEWHSDSCYRAIPCNGAILRGIEVTEQGGETLFADLRAAYRELPAQTKARIAGLRARHSFEYMRRQHDPAPMKPEEAAQVPPVTHPLVRVHPATGETSLYLSPVYMESIMGLSKTETRDLLDDLVAWASQPRFVYRHRWRADDVLMWDNRCTMHIVTPFDPRARRDMHRTTLMGDGPVIAARP